MRVICPHCNDRLATRSSIRPVALLHIVYAQCINPDCGWAGKLHLEYVSTSSPSRLPSATVNPAIDPAARTQLLAQINE